VLSQARWFVESCADSGEGIARTLIVESSEALFYSVVSCPLSVKTGSVRRIACASGDPLHADRSLLTTDN
jgi:hypothetical protein